MKTAIVMAAYLVAFIVQTRLMWGLDRTRDRDRCEAISVVYTGAILGVLVAMDRFVLGFVGESAIRSWGDGALFVNWLFYMSYGLAKTPRRHGFSPYLLLTNVLLIGGGLVVWYLVKHPEVIR